MATQPASRVTRATRAQLLHGIYAILNEAPRLLDLAHYALDAGIRIVQYRAKHGISARQVRALREITRDHDALLIMNDRWRAAIEFDCDGVHLGPDDDGYERVAFVREALGDRLIGLSCGTLDEVAAANREEVDYLGIGAVYPTSSKSDAGPPLEIPGLRTLAMTSGLPVAAVGGITAATIPDIRRAGASMAAVISAIESAAAPPRAARELIDAWG